ncbi:MAG TPA: hypothetical protein VGI31_04160, partial [Streptosporangiaceae bacterium]
MLSSQKPTVMQSVVTGQDTLAIELSMEPDGCPGSCSFQDVPFQCWAWSLVVFWKAPPTLVHCFAEAQDTSVRSLTLAPIRFGVLCCVQVLPSQRSASDTT